MIRLYDYWRSSAAYRVRIALGLAGLDWEQIEVNLVDGAQTSPDHLARNPQGLVPVLEIDGQTLTQSLAILDYISETRGLSLLPDPPADRARVRAATHAIAMDIHPVCNLRVAKHAASQSDGGITMESWMQTFIGPGLAAFDRLIDPGTYCFGDDITLADICLMPQLYNAHRWGAAIPRRLTQIESRLSQNPAFAAAHPDATPH